MEGMLKKSLVTKYLDHCREIAGNEQIPIQFSRKHPEATKYDPDRVQDFFKSENDDEEPRLHLKMLEKGIKSQFLQSSLWLK